MSGRKNVKENLETKKEDDYIVEFDCGKELKVLLNQTNISRNNNKFYTIQVRRRKGLYYLWRRWGRVGYEGQNENIPFQSREEALVAFKSKFYDKTGNEWGKSRFVKFTGKYEIVKRGKSPIPKAPKLSKPEVSLLSRDLQDLISLISNLKFMEEEISNSLKYDSSRAPLGKLSNSQIKAGYKALKIISQILKGEKSYSFLQETCNDYYTRIPHEFGMKTPPLISTLDGVIQEIKLLETLSHIKHSIKIFQDSELCTHPLDAKYKALCLNIVPLNSLDQEFSLIEEYIQSTHAPTHNQYSMSVEKIFVLHKHDAKRKKVFKDVGNRTLLFHGSRLSNWAGILAQGLRVAPLEAPSSGYMFGKGIYFADMSSKSANYCFATPKKNVGLLLICEVALGNCNELIEADGDASCLPRGKHSVKGLGKVVPGNTIRLSDGTIVPLGPPRSIGVIDEKGYTLQYNEFVIYNPAQIRMRFLAQIKFDYEVHRKKMAS